MDPPLKLLISEKSALTVREQIGSSDTGVVYRAIFDTEEAGDGDLASQTFCAVKYAMLPEGDDDPLDAMAEPLVKVSAEIVEHRNVMGVKNFVTDDRKLFVMQMPYMVASLRSVMRRNDEFVQGYPEEVILFALRETVAGLVKIHELDAVHGEVSAGRVFIAQESPFQRRDEGMIKLSYGASAYDRLDDDMKYTWRQLRAPEAQGITKYVRTKEGDMWLIGILALELANGINFKELFDPFAFNYVMPLLEETILDVRMIKLAKVAKEDSSAGGYEWKGVASAYTSDLHGIVFKCLELDPTNRPSAKSLLETIMRLCPSDTNDVISKYNLAREDLYNVAGQNVAMGNVPEAQPVFREGQPVFHLGKEIGRSLNDRARVYLAHGVGDVVGDLLVVSFSNDVNLDEDVKTLLNTSNVAQDINNVLKWNQELFSTGEDMYLGLEEVKGSLYDLMSARYKNGLPESKILVIMYRIVEVVSGLHDTGRHHGMLCASHVYIDERGYIKVGCGLTVLDFTTDLERSIHPDAWNVTAVYTETCAPEGQKDSKSDIWAIGVIALELIYGGLAVSDRATFDEIVGQIVKTKMLPACFGSGMRKKEKFSDKFMELLVGCLTNEPKERLLPKVLEKNPMFDQAVNASQLDDFKW